MPNNEKYRDYWLQSARADYEAMRVMYANKQYHWALFIGHLLIEKVLKAIFVMGSDQPLPKIHDLSRLLELCDIEIDEELREKLDVITTFNINARYPVQEQVLSDLPRNIQQQVKHIEEIYAWLKSFLKLR